jgi:hypothetical protein
MKKKMQWVVALVFFLLFVLAIRYTFFWLESTMDNQIVESEKRIMGGGGLDYKTIEVVGIRNWTVVKTYPAPGAVFDVVVVASNKIGIQVIAHGFSGRKIDEGTTVRFVSLTYQAAPRTQRTVSYFVEPIIR